MRQRAAMQEHRCRDEVAREPAEAGENHEQADPAGRSSLPTNEPADNQHKAYEGIDQREGDVARRNRLPLRCYREQQPGRQQGVLQPMHAA